MTKSNAMKPKQPCKVCQEKAWSALKLAQKLEHGLPARSGVYYYNHKNTLLVYYSDNDGTMCAVKTGMSYAEALVAYTQAIVERGGTIDVVAPVGKQSLRLGWAGLSYRGTGKSLRPLFLRPRAVTFVLCSQMRSRA